MNRAEWTRRMVSGGLALLAITSVIQLLPRLANADEASEKKGAALMDKFVEVTGGKAAYEAIKSRTVTGQQVLSGGQTGKFELYWVHPNKFRSIVELPVGSLERGSDGKTVWVSFPSGAVIVEGAERVKVIRDSTQDRFGRWRSIFQKAEYVGDENVDGTQCSKVMLTLKPIDPKVEEAPVTAFIAQDSGLIVQWTTELTGEMAGPQGDQEVTIRFSDYRKIGDVRIPHQMKAAVPGNEINVKIKTIVFNTEVPADKFALPEAVQEQLKDNHQDSKDK